MVRPHPKTISRRRAFTLIELMVVMAIIVILVAVSVPLFKTLTKNNDSAQATNMLSSLIANARSIAISQGRIAGVALYEDTSTTTTVGGAQTSAMFVVEDRTLSTANTLYLFPYNSSIQPLPEGSKVASLDTQNGSVQLTASAGGAATKARVVLFDAQGQLVVRGNLAFDKSGSSTWSTYDASTQNILTSWANSWQWATSSPFTTNTSTPGLIVYSDEEFKAANPTGTSPGNINTWLQSHANILVVNAYTGTLIR